MHVQEANTKPGFIARMLRQGVKQEIKKWIGFDVYVGSTARKCDTNNPISESMSNHVKRRLSTDEVMNELTTMLDYEVNIDGYNNASDAVEELCNTLNERILDDIAEKTNRKVSLKEKDELYWYLFNWQFISFIEPIRYNNKKNVIHISFTELFIQFLFNNITNIHGSCFNIKQKKFVGPSLF